MSLTKIDTNIYQELLMLESERVLFKSRPSKRDWTRLFLHHFWMQSSPVTSKCGCVAKKELILIYSNDTPSTVAHFLKTRLTFNSSGKSSTNYLTPRHSDSLNSVGDKKDCQQMTRNSRDTKSGSWLNQPRIVPPNLIKLSLRQIHVSSI